jgi:hypothetical protein
MEAPDEEFVVFARADPSTYDVALSLIPGAVYAIALSPEPGGGGAVVEFPYRLVANLGSVQYYALDPGSARSDAERAFIERYLSLPGAVRALGSTGNTYTLAVRPRARPPFSVDPHPSLRSPDGAFYLSGSPTVETIRLLASGPGAAAAVTRARLAASQSLPSTTRTAPATVAGIERERAIGAAFGGPVAVGGQVGALIRQDREARLRQMPRWVREIRGAPEPTPAPYGGGPGRRLGTASEAVVPAAAAATTTRPAPVPTSPTEYGRLRVAQLASQTEWVQERQALRARLAREAIDRERDALRRTAMETAERELGPQGPSEPTMQYLGRLRQRADEIVRRGLGRAREEAIRAEAAARADAQIDDAIERRVDEEMAAGLFFPQPALEINVAPQPPTAPPETGRPQTRRRPSLKQASTAVREEAMKAFQRDLVGRLQHLSNESEQIRDIIAEWAAATNHNPAGYTGADLRNRALDWWTARQWAQITPQQRSRYASEAAARGDSTAVVAAEAAFRQLMEDRAAVAAARARPARVRRLRPPTGTAESAAAAAAAPGPEEEEERESLMDEAERARIEAQRASAAPEERPARRARSAAAAAAAATPPGIFVSRPTGELVEVPRMTFAPVPVPVGAPRRRPSPWAWPGRWRPAPVSWDARPPGPTMRPSACGASPPRRRSAPPGSKGRPSRRGTAAAPPDLFLFARPSMSFFFCTLSIGLRPADETRCPLLNKERIVFFFLKSIPVRPLRRAPSLLLPGGPRSLAACAFIGGGENPRYLLFIPIGSCSLSARRKGAGWARTTSTNPQDDPLPGTRKKTDETRREC